MKGIWDETLFPILINNSIADHSVNLLHISIRPGKNIFHEQDQISRGEKIVPFEFIQ